ncbi:LysR family transcriptional regulator [Mesorhizobium sp.]|uniref:LysR family transcriptional regulator n=1 Tax=Mesorhizobium sp. TaxID=1871066 RepID=UPI0025D4EFBC|nr:LysR family transcriptional regulator [Mesorhizobium sp.]
MENGSASVEFRQLRYFIAAAECGSFRKAARTLNVQQSAISRRIRDLEDEIGASLFQRGAYGVSLTYAGERFLRKARQGLEIIREGTRTIATVGRGEEGVVRIGIFSSLASGFLSKLMCAFDKRHHNVTVDFIHGSPAEHIAAIRQLRLDVAFITGMSMWKDCDTAHLWSERVFAVLPARHPLAERIELGWTDLAGESFIISELASGPIIHDYLIQHFADLGYHPDIQLQYVDRDSLFGLVALGRGLTLTSEATTAAQFPGTVYRPITGEMLPFSAVWSPRNDNPAFRRFLSLARSMASSQKSGSVKLRSSTIGANGALSQKHDPSP